jgi:hypothetical protein
VQPEQAGQDPLVVVLKVVLLERGGKTGHQLDIQIGEPLTKILTLSFMSEEKNTNFRCEPRDDINNYMYRPAFRAQASFF